MQKELNETVVRSREEIEERLETEDRQQLGDISDEVYNILLHTRHTHTLNSTCACRGEYVYIYIYIWHSLSRHRAQREKVARCLFSKDPSSHLIADVVVSVKTL